MSEKQHLTDILFNHWKAKLSIIAGFGIVAFLYLSGNDVIRIPNQLSQDDLDFRTNSTHSDIPATPYATALNSLEQAAVYDLLTEICVTDQKVNQVIAYLEANPHEMSRLLESTEEQQYDLINIWCVSQQPAIHRTYIPLLTPQS